MADREQSSKRAMQPKPQREVGGTVGQRHGGQGHAEQDRERGLKPDAMVGRDVPDESKEHHTEIAVEAGRKSNDNR